MDAAISPKPAQELIDNIINSVEFSPSAELEQELAEVRKTCPDLAVSKDFPPLKWPATVDETGLNIVEHIHTRPLGSAAARTNPAVEG